MSSQSFHSQKLLTKIAEHHKPNHPKTINICGIQDARVHCVVLNIRSVPTRLTQSQPRRPKSPIHHHSTPQKGSREAAGPVPQDPTACTPVPIIIHTFPAPKGVLHTNNNKHRIVKCSTHERHRPTFATEMTSAPHDKACVLSAP